MIVVAAIAFVLGMVIAGGIAFARWLGLFEEEEDLFYEFGDDEDWEAV